ncbi:G patch domain-containing protein 4-like [Homarus americanus]|uniref:G patch domain-containing protein 4 n=1 Tax=Homarus americanus TaxID=6706 RepID=A0A8J5N255_HOMAM|nr:G patch domain-containing protein 4-like [Homarus americanus]KAG7171928.1 G patch domain-containing protein 4-like [Homarus americanus]
MTSSGLKFAQLELEKYGWKEGKGLGREESGMTKAIKPKLKFDSSGLGHDIAEEFKFHWWDHVFNETAANISVDKTQYGSVQLSRKKEVIHVNKKKSSVDNKAKLYGSFVEGGILLGGNEEKEKSESEESEHEQKFSHQLTDEELFKICGGRTAHKGARHGLNMSAKLARSEELERLWMQKWATSDEQAQQEPVEGETKEKKKRKKQKQNRGEDISEIDTMFDVKLTKEKKVKVHKNENTNFTTKDLERSGMSNKLKKRKRDGGSALESPLEVVKNESSNDHNCSEELTNEDIEQPESQDSEMNRCKRKEKKKKRKNKETAVDDTNECAGDGKEMKKKKRKKVKCAGEKENSCTEVEEQEAKIVKEEIEVNQVCSESETTEPKKKMKKKLKDNDDKVQHTEGNSEVVQVTQKKKKKRRDT